MYDEGCYKIAALAFYQHCIYYAIQSLTWHRKG